MKAPLLHLLLLALVCLAVFTTATQVHDEPGCAGQNCNMIPSGALPMAHQHRKLLKSKIEGGSGFSDEGDGGRVGPITSSIGSGGGSNAYNYPVVRAGGWDNYASEGGSDSTVSDVTGR